MMEVFCQKIFMWKDPLKDHHILWLNLKHDDYDDDGCGDTDAGDDAGDDDTDAGDDAGNQIYSNVTRWLWESAEANL